MNRLLILSLSIAITMLSSFEFSIGEAVGESRSSQKVKKRALTLEASLKKYIQQGTDSSSLPGQRYLVDGKNYQTELVDVAVHAKAGHWIAKHEEFNKKSTEKNALDALRAGEILLRRIEREGKRIYQTGSQICGYVSEVDSSVQPYAVSLPEGFDVLNPKSKRYPLYVVVHGRGGMNEVRFINRYQKKEPEPGQTWIQLDVFGRIDNAFRWAGETDVFEAMKDVERRFAIDKNRITLWGFSMGGAGAWHLGLHHPDRWASVGAGAGFVDFYRYQNKKEHLANYQHLPLRIYDSVGYARNLANVPFVTYGGDQDKQILASQMMVEAAKPLDVPVKFIIGKNIGHKFTPEAKKEFMEFHKKHNEKGKPRFPGPAKIRFSTFTPKYNKCHWLEIEELEKMYEEAIVESDLKSTSGVLELKTQNVALLKISRDIATEISIDGQARMPLAFAAEELLPVVYYEKIDGSWELYDYDQSRVYQESGQGNKRHNLQGPIDDAFMSSFICVRGTGSAWSQEHERWARWTLRRFQLEFDKWMRAEVRIVNDRDLTPEMIQNHHLILFGDPGSNKIISRVIKDLPIQWEKEEFKLGGKTYSAKSNGAALIHPNPLNPKKYVVLNSGMTTHEKDFKASNSWLFPKLGDVAVLEFKKSSTGYEEKIKWANLFDRSWKLQLAK